MFFSLIYFWEDFLADFCFIWVETISYDYIPHVFGETSRVPADLQVMKLMRLRCGGESEQTFAGVVCFKGDSVR